VSVHSEIHNTVDRFSTESEDLSSEGVVSGRSSVDTLVSQEVEYSCKIHKENPCIHFRRSKHAYLYTPGDVYQEDLGTSQYFRINKSVVYVRIAAVDGKTTWSVVNAHDHATVLDSFEYHGVPFDSIKIVIKSVR